MSRWIHVKEALPDEDCMCLVARTWPWSVDDRQLHVSIGEFTTDLSECRGYGSCPGFIELDDDGPQAAEDVYYWRPLPNPPAFWKCLQDKKKYKDVKLPWERLYCKGCIHANKGYDVDPCYHCYGGHLYKKKPEDAAND